MRQIFIRNCDNKLLLTNENAWTDEGAKAKDFGTSLNALAFCLQHDLAHTEILVKFNLPGVRDVTVPVDGRQTASVESQLPRTTR